MSERTSTALFLSLLLHGAAVAAIFALAFAVQQRRPPPEMIFDLVAGPGNDLTATEAPALGTPDGDLKVKVHEPPGHVEPIPVAPAEPVPPAPVKAATERVTPPRTKPTAAERARAEARTTPPKSEARMTYEQYVKQHGVPRAGTTGAPRAIAAPRISTKGIVDGVEGGSANSTRGAGGTAMTAAEHTEMQGYISRLVAALRQSHEKPPGLSDLLSADVEFLIAADGTLSRVRIARSSGNAAFDESCLEAFRRVGSVGPKPDGKSATWILEFRMKDE
ncbi:MAG TPA: energy transducer TonB [Opitutaceae bacterium]|nr:energy transducer TonB [Opitutaceae bacterium]